MAHLVDTMMYVGEKPWHGLGEYVGDKNVTSAVAMEKAKMDWEVKKQKTFYIFNGKQKLGLGYDVIRQDNGETVGHVGETFVPLQNKKAFEFMDGIIGSGRAVYHTAGSLKGGSKIWMLVDMKEEDEIVKGDNVRNFILLSNAHDGTQMLNICLTAVRVVCNNTLQIALSTKEQGMFSSFKHSGKMAGKMGDVALTLAMASEKFSKFVEQGKLLAKKQLTRADLDNFLIRLELERANTRENGFDKEKIEAFKRTTKYQELTTAFYRSPGAKEAGHTLWGALNAVTYHVDHEASSRVTDNFSGQEEARLNSAWFNAGTVRKNRALELCLEIASKG